MIFHTASLIMLNVQVMVSNRALKNHLIAANQIIICLIYCGILWSMKCQNRMKTKPIIYQSWHFQISISPELKDG